MEAIQTRRILWVEDDPDDTELITFALREAGLEARVAFARDGLEALDYLLARGAYSRRDAKQSPAGIVLDFKLPKMDAPELLECLRADTRLRRLPVVVFTSSGRAEDAAICRRLGAVDVITKPVDCLQFPRAVQDIARRWL